YLLEPVSRTKYFLLSGCSLSIHFVKSSVWHVNLSVLNRPHEQKNTSDFSRRRLRKYPCLERRRGATGRKRISRADGYDFGHSSLAHAAQSRVLCGPAFH